MRRTLSFLICFLLLFKCASAQVAAQRKSTNTGRIGVSINNYGTIGKPDVRSNTQGPPSMAFPRGSGVDHLFEAGLWIGALVDGQTRVSTSSVDASSGYTTGGSGFEFSQLSGISERSKLPSSSNYSASAISHQDFVFQMTDSFVVVPGTSIPINGHQNPLKAICNVESYAWNYSFADYFVMVNYKIKNASDKRWDSVYLGIFSDLVVRNINVTRDAGTAFFNKGRNAVNRQYNALFAYESFGDDIDFTKSYGAIQFLGMDWKGLFFNPAKPDTFVKLGYPKPVVNYNFWNFSSVAPPWTTPTNDQERYLKLITPIDSVNLLSGTGPTVGTPANWIQLISAGPLANVAPGESFNFTVAFVCAKQKDPITYYPTNASSILSTPESEVELVEHLKRTRATYVGEDVNEDGVYRAELDLNQNGKLDRYVLPEPPITPHTKIIARENAVDIYWDNVSESSVDPLSRKKDFEGYRIYRTNIGDDKSLNLISDANLISQWDSAGNDVGFNNGFSQVRLQTPIQFDGDTTVYRYKYTLDNLSNGWQYLVIVTAFDQGDKVLGIDPLESSYSENELHAFAGTTPNDFGSAGKKKVGVYPNPYNTKAAWDGDNSRNKKLIFYNLPSKCEITVYTSSGDVLTQIKHDAATYTGEDIRWFTSYSDPSKTVMSGGEHAWDILNSSKTQLSSGVYLFTVKDLKTGEVETGSFALIK